LDERKIALASEIYNTVKEDAASAASSAASALNLAARDSKGQHATLKHKIDRHLKQAAFHSQRATS
jgi:hypothetical protein